MIIKFYVFSVLLTILWSLGVHGLVPIIYVLNTLPIMAIILLYKRVMYTREIIVLLVLLLLNIVFFQTGIKFAIKLLSYISVFALSYSLNIKYNLKMLNGLLILCVMLFFISKFSGIGSHNFFFQRNSFPSFIFGLAGLIAFRANQRLNYFLFLLVILTVLSSSTIGAVIALVAAYIVTQESRKLILNLGIASIGILALHVYVIKSEFKP